MHSNALIVKLFEIGAVRFGSFPLKNGSTSPIYIDLRLILAHPKLLVSLAEALYNRVKACSVEWLCPVPHTALPLATAISIGHSIPMIWVAKESPLDVQEKKPSRPKQSCLVLDDLITSGQNVLGTIALLEREGLSTDHVAVLVDREQGGSKRVESLGYKVHALFTLSGMVRTLEKEGLIDSVVASTVLTFLKL